MKYIMSPCYLIDDKKQKKLVFKYDPEETEIIFYSFLGSIRKSTVEDIVGFQVKNSSEIVYSKIYFDKQSLIDFIAKHLECEVDPKISDRKIKDLSIQAIQKILEKNQPKKEPEEQQRKRGQSLTIFSAKPAESSESGKRSTFNIKRSAF